MGSDTTAPKRLILNRPPAPDDQPATPARSVLGGGSGPITIAPPAATAPLGGAGLSASRVPSLRPPLAASRSLAAVQSPVAPTRGLSPVTAVQPSVSVAATPMRRELDRPLSELVAKRGAQDINLLFADLVALGVSDVHMTRTAGARPTFTIEARVDSKKQLVHTYEGSEAQTLCTRIKTEAKMTTGSNKVPEDGSYILPIDGHDYRARAVSLPLHDGGERIVFRLPQTGPLRPLDQLGFTDTNFAKVMELLALPGGMTLFAGPMGEGKSTSSLSALDYLQSQDDGVVITLEDPVERVVAGLSQIEVNEDLEGAGFADMMKYLVRSDANVLFIGEIRDAITATAAVEIAKSGRRVIGTIHATDNISAFMRLIGLADETPLSVLDSVNGIISQRLVPRLVPGTDRFAGRYPIHEVTLNSDDLTDALVANVSRACIRAAAAATSTTFKQNVDELVAAGITTLDEAQKVVRNV